MTYHQPVLATAAVEALNIQPGGVYVDATFGGGGHSRLILQDMEETAKLIAFDQDADAQANVPDDERLVFIPNNFRYLKRFLRLHGITAVDGILADLGVSSHQFDEAERGFSFRFDSLLDMRMNRAGDRKASDIINTYPAEALQHLFSRYGEVRNAKTLALKIVQDRHQRPIQSVQDFLGVIEPLIRGQRQRYLAQVFQALRIEVNEEMEALQEFLKQSLEILKPAGRIVVISYHSIEDRLVKNFLKTGNFEGQVEKDFYGNIFRPFQLVTRKAIVPEKEEQQQNPRSRSAKMRVAAKNKA